jgi:hypothetical protein
MHDSESSFSQGVIIKPTQGNQIEVTWTFRCFIKNEAGKKSCFIPGFDIYFSADDNDIIKRKAAALTKFFFDYFFIDNSKDAIKKLALELHKRGFKAEHDAAVMHSYVNLKIVPAKFSNTLVIPIGYNATEANTFSSTMQVAI